MSPQVVIALGIVLLTMAAGLAGILLRRRAAVSGTSVPIMPRWLVITLLGIGVVVVLITVAGLWVVLVRGA